MQVTKRLEEAQKKSDGDQREREVLASDARGHREVGAAQPAQCTVAQLHTV